ncbi:MAG TPA: Ig-like domain repeat protein [Acidimicrobiales bacterium]|nr:Ig-like domain repeat protein [Acidimicrobiales bacterium]
MRVLSVVVLLLGGLATVPGPSAASSAGQTVTIFSQPEQVQTIVGGPDGAVWFGEPLARKIVRIDGAGVTTAYPVSSEPFTITRGPDGNVWYVGDRPTVLGRITPAGVVTEFPIAGECCGRRMVATATDVWFSLGTNHLGRSDMAGNITLFPTPGNFNSWGDLTLGPDGNIWYGSENNAVGRVTPSGVITEFPVADGVRSITAGPDGNIWFALANASAIGRMSTSGALLPDVGVPGNVYIPQVEQGPDGAVWFAANDSSGQSYVGRTDGSGVLIFERVASIAELTAGPDGNVWFATYGSTVGRLSLPGATITTLTTSADPVNENVPVTYTATVTAPFLSGTPSGSVQFFDEITIPATALTGPIPLSGGVASASITFPLGPRSHYVRARYTGDGAFLDSVSPVLFQHVRGVVTIHALPAVIHGNPSGGVLNLTATLSHGSDPVYYLQVAMRDSSGQVLCWAINTAAGGTGSSATCSVLLDPLAALRVITGGGYTATVDESAMYASVSAHGVLLGIGGI